MRDPTGGASRTVSIVIATYRREHVLIETIASLLPLEPRAIEILVIDQSAKHDAAVADALETFARDGHIRYLRLGAANIPAAMNIGLRQAHGDIVLFVDDDVRPTPQLLEAHRVAYCATGVALVAGRVIQPWEASASASCKTGYPSAQLGTTPRFVDAFIGANFSVDRRLALQLGGFDENFARAAYRFEVEFAFRWLQSGRRIFYEPRACLHHLKARTGGTRAFSDHLRTARPDHSVGEYYCLLRTWRGWPSLRALAMRPFKAIATRHHLRSPWWVPLTLIGEATGAVWAASLALRGPKLAPPC